MQPVLCVGGVAARALHASEQAAVQPCVSALPPLRCPLRVWLRALVSRSLLPPTPLPLRLPAVTPQRDPPAEALEALTLEGVQAVMTSRLHPTNLELNVAGDFDAGELEELVLQYMGAHAIGTARH